MNFGNYLRKARERNLMTQITSAEKIGVTVTTIQNWEKDILPDKNYWSDIIKVYSLNKEEFFFNLSSFIPSEVLSIVPSFPYFLFPSECINTLKNLNLTEEEQELLGLEMIYYTDFETRGEFHFTINSKTPLSFLPYEYLKDVGAFRVFRIYESLNKKLGSYKEFVIKWLIRHPEELFNLDKLNINEIFTLSSSFKQPSHYNAKEYYGEIRKTLTDSINELIQKVRHIGDLDEQKLFVRNLSLDKNSDQIDWLDCFVRDSYFSKYITEQIEEDNEEEYKRQLVKYERDLAFYKEHKTMLDKPPVPPQKIMAKYAVLTETGKKVYAWYKQKIL